MFDLTYVPRLIIRQSFEIIYFTLNMIAPNESGSALGSVDGDGEISGYGGGCELWTGSGGCICGNIFRGGEIYFSLKYDEDLHAYMTQSRHLFKIFNIVWRKRCMPTNWSVFLKQAAISCLRCSRITILHILSHSSSMTLVSYILVYRTMITSRIKTSFPFASFLLYINSTIQTTTGTGSFFWKSQIICGRDFRTFSVRYSCIRSDIFQTPNRWKLWSASVLVSYLKIPCNDE